MQCCRTSLISAESYSPFTNKHLSHDLLGDLKSVIYAMQTRLIGSQEGRGNLPTRGT